MDIANNCQLITSTMGGSSSWSAHGCASVDGSSCDSSDEVWVTLMVSGSRHRGEMDIRYSRSSGRVHGVGVRTPAGYVHATECRVNRYVKP